MSTLEKDMQELENMLETLQEATSLDTSIKAYEKAVKKANLLLEKLSQAQVEIQTHQVGPSARQ